MDVEQCGDISEGECVVLAREGEGQGHGETKTGDEAIRSITSMDDEYVWAATSSSDVHRWRDVGRRVCRMDLDYDGASYGDEATQGLVQPINSLTMTDRPTSIIDSPLRARQLAADGDNELTRVESRESRGITFAPSPRVDGASPILSAVSPPASPSASALPASVRERLNPQGYRRTTLSGASVANSVMSESSLQAGDLCLNGIPYESLVCLGLPDSPYSYGFSGGAHSVTSLASARRPDDSPEVGPNDRALPPRVAARRAFEDREVASEAVPLRPSPDSTIAGSPGLIRSLVLNDRLHALTLDTTGEVAVWHLVRGTCLGRFAYKDIEEALELERGISDARTEIKMHPHEVLEIVQRRIEGKNSVLPWCQVDTKVGQITVHLEGDRVFAADILSDEMGGEDISLSEEAIGKLCEGSS